VKFKEGGTILKNEYDAKESIDRIIDLLNTIDTHDKLNPSKNKIDSIKLKLLRMFFKTKRVIKNKIAQFREFKDRKIYISKVSKSFNKIGIKIKNDDGTYTSWEDVFNQLSKKWNE
jgi:hypothetical protein